MHKIPENFKDFDEALEYILVNFDSQMETFGIEDSTFHHSLIELISKYPDSKELIQFIVSINDKLETKNEQVKDVLAETLREIIIMKQHSIKKIAKDLKENEKTTTVSKVKNALKTVPAKYLFIGIAVVLGFITFYILPDQVIAFTKILSTLK